MAPLLMPENCHRCKGAGSLEGATNAAIWYASYRTLVVILATRE